jgi:hypothetical protein
MAIYKDINSATWYITVDSGVGTIYVDGNLDVTGNITYVSEIAVNDAFIVVAANNTPAANVTDSGLIATKPTNPQTFAGLRFDSTVNAWQISPSVTISGAAITPYSNLAASGAVVAAGANTEIQFNNGGVLGANTNLAFDFATSKLTVQGQTVLGNIGNTPSATANSVALYNKAVGIGNTGLYVVGNTVNDEVIAATKARLYSIIF